LCWAVALSQISASRESLRVVVGPHSAPTLLFVHIGYGVLILYKEKKSEFQPGYFWTKNFLVGEQRLPNMLCGLPLTCMLQVSRFPPA